MDHEYQTQWHTMPAHKERVDGHLEDTAEKKEPHKRLKKMFNPLTPMSD